MITAMDRALVLLSPASESAPTLCLEAGDEMFWDNGVNRNFKVMGGPQIRF